MVEMDAKDMLFVLELFQYGNNVMAAIAGATASNKPETSMVSTILGSIMSGAATGAGIGTAMSPVGGLPGAVIGGVLGLASAIF
jgi:hypothetical protein